MTKTIYSLLPVLLIGLMTTGCQRKDDKQLVITGELISNTACKNDLKSAFQIAGIPDSLSCVEYSFDNENNKLTIKHINAGFNCCPDRLYCKIELKGNTIIIQEFEKSANCDCLCLYDLDIEINGVYPKKYQLEFAEPYASEQNKLEFEIDLSKDTKGSFCVTRKHYPWGVNSVTE